MSAPTTRYDAPAAALAVPGSLGAGTDPALAVVDHVVRGRRIVGRCAAPAGLVGVALAPVDHALHVTVELRLDRAAGDWRAYGAVPAADPGAARVGPGVPARPGRTPDDERPRLLLVSATGDVRRGVLLARARRGADHVRARVCFVVPAGAVPADGLLVVDLADAAARLPAEVAAGFAPAGPAGVRIDRLDVTPAAPVAPTGTGPVDGRTAEWSGLVSAGGAIGSGGDPRIGAAHSPYLVVNPVADTPLTCRIRTSLAPDRPAGAGAPARVARAVEGALRRALPAPARPVPAQDVRLRALDLRTGEPVPVDAVADGAELAVLFPAPPAGPVLLHTALCGEPPRRARLVAELTECAAP
ncbi:hypothetical protein GCM10010123_22050 [Pilimelia anulata]|uniref:Uncharacterized protein n=1 Tax=Pilimelia anulata TaxID=53371 RepID=A0A8J3BB71_9ACTN|nr:hypothetical protein [Pilimelia anulata]GGJ91846.1 hypothetical protein GCM10010123_22050 [Pilimelia anulata]